MLKRFLVLAVGFIALSLVLGSPLAFAKKGEGDKPFGWSKGEKKGWGEGDIPPGLSKKDAKKAEKEAKKAAKKAEKEARKKAKQAEKETKKL